MTGLSRRSCMLRFSLAILLLLVALPVKGEPPRTLLVSGSYFSWLEEMKLRNATTQESAFAALSGTSLHLERRWAGERFGFAADLSILYGLATGGSSSALGSSVRSSVFWGVRAVPRGEWYLSPQVAFATGPLMSYRNLDWDSRSAALTVESGSDFNVGALGQIRIRLSPRWEIRQEVGGYFDKARTLWALGVDYLL